MILLVGSEGFVGHNVFQAMEDKKSVIRVDLNDPVGSMTKGFIKTDMSAEDFPDRFPDAEIDTIINTAAMLTRKCNESPRAAVVANVAGMVNLLELARKKDITNVVHISTFGVYKKTTQRGTYEEDSPKEPTDMYGMTKLAAEIMLRGYSEKYGINSKSLRITAPYGPGMEARYSGDKGIEGINRHPHYFAERCVNGQPIKMSFGGDHTIDYTYVKDIVQAIFKAASEDVRGFNAFNITGGRAYSIAELGEVCRMKCPGLEIQIGKGDLLESSEEDSLTRRMASIQGNINIEKAMKVLKYEPEYDLARGMSEYIDYLRLAR